MNQLSGTVHRLVGTGGYGQTATLIQWSNEGTTDAWDDQEISKSTTDINVVPTSIGQSISSGDVENDAYSQWREADLQLITDYDGSVTQVGDGDDKKTDELTYDGERYLLAVDFEFEGARYMGLVRETTA